MLEKVVVTTGVKEVCAFGSVVRGVTVSTVDCVIDGATGAVYGNKTNVQEEASVVTEAATAILGGAIVLQIVVGVGLATAVDFGVIVTLNIGCSNRLETGSAVLKRLVSDDACSIVGETNKRGAPPENVAPNTTDAKPGVEECGKRIGISGREPALELDSWDCYVVV